MKKILILSVTAGNGHNACARFVKNKMEDMEGENVEIKIVDVLKTYSTKGKVWIADGGYNLSVSKFLPIYHLCFKHYKNISVNKPYRRWMGGTQKTAKSIVGGLLKEILMFQPDVVFCTHFYAAIALTDLKLVYDLPCKIVLTSLDYENSPFWESAIGVDYFNVPAPELVEENLNAGFKKEQMITLGIPVDERTLAGITKIDARRQLGIKEDVITFMVMFGGGFWKGGFKIFNDLINILNGRKAQVIMINGKNEKDFNRIAKMTFPKGIEVVNVGFTKDVPLYMAASDVILNKCGGLCATEMVNVGRPMVITEKVPTQEIYNLEFLKSKGVAMSFKNKKQLAENINKLYDNESLRKEMEEGFVDLRKNACVDLAKFILSFDKVDYSGLLKQAGSLVEGENVNVNYKDKTCGVVRKKVKIETKKAHKKSVENRKLK